VAVPGGGGPWDWRAITTVLDFLLLTVLTELLFLICFFGCIIIIIGQPLLAEQFVPLGFPRCSLNVYLHFFNKTLID